MGCVGGLDFLGSDSTTKDNLRKVGVTNKTQLQMKHGKDILIFCELFVASCFEGRQNFKLSGYGEKLAVMRGKFWKVLWLYL